MNRRHFGLGATAAVLLAQQLRQALAQDAGRPASSVDRDSAWRMRDAATAFLESLDAAARKAVSFPLEADQRTSWSNLPVALVPRVGVNVGALGRKAGADSTICSAPLRAVKATIRLRRSCAMTIFCGPRNWNICSTILQGRELGATPSRVWDRQTIGLRCSVSPCAASPGPGCLQDIISAPPLPVPAAEWRPLPCFWALSHWRI